MRHKSELVKIYVGFDCNNACVFCCDRTARSLSAKTTAELKKEIMVARRLASRLHLIGGEPTIRADILELVSYARGRGFEYIMLTTNGRRLSEFNFTYQLVKAGVSQLVISLHGHSAVSHDFLTARRGSFAQLKRGISNLKKLGFKNIGINTTVSKRNFRHLDKIAKIVSGYKITRWELIWIAAEPENFKKLVPLISDAAPFINKILAIGQKKQWRWNFLNPPMSCCFASYRDSIRYGDSRDEKLFLKNKKGKDYFNFSQEKILNYKKIEKCRLCRLSSVCPGVDEAYLGVYGAGEVKSILKL
jgi:MoaA/NifB/PqqE/SkfB family radical SAM enzyme